MELDSFDLTLNVVGAQASIPDDESGGQPVVLISLTVGAALPLGPQPLIAPLGKLRFALPKEQAKEIGRLADQLPDEKISDVTIATSMADIDQFAKNLGKIR